MSRSVLEQIRNDLVAGVTHYERRKRRSASALGAIAALVLVVGTAAVWNAGGEGDSRVIVGPVSSGPLDGLEEVPAPPVSSLPTQGLLGVVPVWTGSELLAVGAIDDAGTVVSVAFNPTTQAWRQLPTPPITVGQGAPAVWTGEELIICCGGTPEGSATAAYNPRTNVWRSLPDAPVGGYANAVWTGERVIVVSVAGVASLEPSSGQWTMLPAPSNLDVFMRAVWTGSEMVVWPSPSARTVSAGESFDPLTNRWAVLSDPPAGSWPAIPDIAWLGDSLAVLGGLPAPGPTSERFVGSRFDPSIDTWTALPDPLPEPNPCECNLGSHVSLWTGNDLLVFVGALASGASADGVLLALDPADNSWRTVGDTGETALTPVAMAGDRVFLERDGKYYLSQPGWRPRLESSLAPQSTLCTAARHPWQVGPSSDDESGDGLPPSGTATRDLADRVLNDQGSELVSRYGASSANVRAENGRAWRRHDGSIEIEDEQIATIVLLLPSADSCPSAPAFVEGIPLTFAVRDR